MLSWNKGIITSLSLQLLTCRTLNFFNWHTVVHQTVLELQRSSSLHIFDSILVLIHFCIYVANVPPYIVIRTFVVLFRVYFFLSLMFSRDSRYLFLQSVLSQYVICKIKTIIRSHAEFIVLYIIYIRFYF